MPLYVAGVHTYTFFDKQKLTDVQCSSKWCSIYWILADDKITLFQDMRAKADEFRRYAQKEADKQSSGPTQ